MSCFKYCILGMENAGKTEYIQKIGNLDIGSREFKITVDKNEIPNSEKTDPTAYFENNYSLYSYDKQIFQFSWNDYSGNILKNREEYMQSYEKLQNDLVESDFLIIMINGDYFIQDSKEAITKELKRKYARFINPCISYSAEQQNGKTPPILFAITKCTQFLSKHSNAEISEIIQEAFNGIFSDEKSERIILMDNETEAAIKVPVLLSLENSLQECAANRKKALLENNAKLQDQVSDYQSFLKEQEERLILKNPFKIKEAKEEIFRLHTIIQKNNKLLSNDSIFSQERAFQSIVKKELSRNFNYLVYGFDDVQPEEVKSEVENNRNPVVSFVIGAVLLFLLYLLAEITIWEHPFWFSISTALVTFVYSRKQRFLVPFLILCLIIYVSISMWCYALVIISGVLQLGMMIGFYLKKIKLKEKRKMADTRFTALGMSGSGKTCYLLGMYYEMCVGVRKFTLVTTNQAASKLEDWMYQLDDETGMDRFPSGTSLTEFTNYSFKLCYKNVPIMTFDWADYGGGTMRARENNPEVFAKLNDSIEKSSVLYIFIDGDLLCSDDTETKIKNVKRKCSRTINGYIQNFSESHENLPPIVFVVTKADLCGPYLNPGEMTKILEEAFSNVFYSENLIYVVAVSLGEEISDDDYSGDVEPVNIHIPFFIGIFHEFLNYCYYLKEKFSKKQQEHQDRISANKDAIDYEQDRWFFTDYDRIARCRKQIEEEKKKINNNIELFDRYRKLLTAIADELTNMSENFIVLKNGNEINFSFKDFISEI